MGDPSQGVHHELIPHVHLLSTYHFPTSQQLHHERVVQYLLNAPKIARDQAAFYWTYLDRPNDGHVHLVWQSPTLGKEYPSDGYIWAAGETVFQMEVAGGYTLEMHNAKAGFAQGDLFATHARRRYRLLPSRAPTASVPSTDPNMWIVHYCRAAAEDRIPTSLIHIDSPGIQHMLNARVYLKSQGQIVQKDFMLHDRTNWPQIPFPRGQRLATYGNNIPPARVSQTIAYPPHGVMPGPPQKRVRTDDGSIITLPSGSHPMLGEDDEEDTSRGDYWDMVQPREISESRYVQNHLWMEEVVSSQYPLNRIAPSDLGLGLRGELGKLTEGIFDAPLAPYDETTKPEHVYVGHLDADKANDFRKRVSDHVENTIKEIEHMETKHARRLAKFKKGRLVNVAEQQLRTAVDDPLDIGSEYWRLEGRIETNEQGDEETPPPAPAKVANILARVEASLHRHVTAFEEMKRIQDGGYEDLAFFLIPHISRQPSHSGSHRSDSGIMAGDTDNHMGGSTSGIIDHFQSALSSNPTPGHTPQAHSAGLSAAGTPQDLRIPSPQPLNTSMQLPGYTDNNLSSAARHPLSSAGGNSMPVLGSDWVIVPPHGASPDLSAPSHTLAPSTSHVLALPFTTAAESPLPDFTTSQEDDNHNQDFAELADLDTAGDALATEQVGSVREDSRTTMSTTAAGADDGGLGELDLNIEGMGEDLEMGDMEDLMEGMGHDSAFGDAFVGAEENDTAN